MVRTADAEPNLPTRMETSLARKCRADLTRRRASSGPRGQQSEQWLMRELLSACLTCTMTHRVEKSRLTVERGGYHSAPQDQRQQQSHPAAPQRHTRGRSWLVRWWGWLLPPGQARGWGRCGSSTCHHSRTGCPLGGSERREVGHRSGAWTGSTLHKPSRCGWNFESCGGDLTSRGWIGDERGCPCVHSLVSSWQLQKHDDRWDYLRVKPLPQTGQLCGRAPTWESKWRERCSDRRNVLSQNVQLRRELAASDIVGQMCWRGRVRD